MISQESRMRRPSLIAALCLPTLLGAAVVEDFTTAPEPTLVQASERGTSAAVESAPGTNDPALVVRIAEQHGKLHEVYLAKSERHDGPATVTVRVKRGGTFPFWSVALRVKDAKGECFQFAPSASPEAEWTTLRFAVAEGLHKGHWGKPSTGIMDGAWSVAGFAVSCGEQPGAGEVWFDDVAYETATTP
jgi:hypothetical protein